MKKIFVTGLVCMLLFGGAADTRVAADELSSEPETIVQTQMYLNSSGWQDVAGGTPVAKNDPLKSLRVNVVIDGVSQSVNVSALFSGKGWSSKTPSDQLAERYGTERTIEAVKMELDEELADQYDLYYRAYQTGLGWLGWAKNGSAAGSEGFSIGLGSFEAQVVPKGSAPPSTDMGTAFIASGNTGVRYQSLSKEGKWSNQVRNGTISGKASGASQLKGLKVGLENLPKGASGKIEYRVKPVQKSWTTYGTNSEARSDGQVIEAIQLRLTGKIASYYDVYYRTFVAGYGWLGWAKNHEAAGTSQVGMPISGIQIMLRKKNQPLSSAKAPLSKEDLKIKKVQALLNKKYRSAKMGIYVKSIYSQKTAGVNQKKVFVAASTGKLPILYYTQKQINQKKLSPTKKFRYDDRVNRFSAAYMRGGTGVLQGKKYGMYQVKDVLRYTASYSDNQGTNFLAYHVAGQYHAAFRREINKIVGRNLTGFPFLMSAQDTGLLMEQVYREGGITLKYLEKTAWDNEKIAKYLPVKVAHKIGVVGSYNHDVAAVYAQQPYLLAVMTDGVKSETIAKMSKEIYQLMK